MGEVAQRIRAVRRQADDVIDDDVELVPSCVICIPLRWLPEITLRPASVRSPTWLSCCPSRSSRRRRRVHPVGRFVLTRRVGTYEVAGDEVVERPGPSSQTLSQALLVARPWTMLPCE